MNKLIITFVAASLVQTVVAQELEWVFPLNIGTANNTVEAMTTDAQNNVIVGGILQGTTDFDPGANTATLVSSGSYDGYIAKYDADGNYLWAHVIGGSESNAKDLVSDVVTDAAGNVYLAGFYFGTADLDPGAGDHTVTSGGLGNFPNSYIIKLDPNGNFLWANDYSVGNIGGSEFILALDMDANGDLILGGQYYSGNFPMVFEANNSDAELTEGQDGHYVLKLDSDGDFIWVKRMDVHAINSIDTDASNNIFIGGEYNGTNDMDPDTSVEVGLQTFGLPDLFVCKWDATGDYQWAHGMGSATVDYGEKIAVDGNGNVHFVGQCTGSIDADPSANTYPVNSGAFIIQYSSNGDLNWAHGIGSGTTGFTDIVADGNNNLIMTGYYSDIVDMNPGAGDSLIGTNSSYEELGILKLTNSGGFVYALGFESRCGNPSLALAQDGSLYLGGTFSGTMDCDPTVGSESLITATGAKDLFVLKLNDEGAMTNGLHESSKEVLTQLYPNPSTDKIHVELTQAATIQLVNAWGVPCASFELENGMNTIDVSRLAAGMYFLQLESGSVKTFVKQ